MKYTSAKANKLLKKLNEEYNSLISEEEQSSTFLAAMGEDIESVRPEYDYEKTQAALENLEIRIIKLKHAINLFNISHKLPSFELTVDEALIYIPQLSKKVKKLAVMKAKLPKSREEKEYYGRSSIIDYRYINYDRKTVSRDYEKASDELSAIQTELDTLNNSEVLEIDM